MNKVIIAGSRDITDMELIRNEMNAYWLEIGAFEVISGMARGVDRIARDIAVASGITVHEMPAEWDRYGKSAGYRRNEDMVALATHGLVFWDGESRGTKHTIDLLTKQNKPYRVVRIGEEPDMETPPITSEAGKIAHGAECTCAPCVS